MRTFTVSDAVECGEWKHYTDSETGNLVWENLHTRTREGWKRRIKYVFLLERSTIYRIKKWLTIH